MRPFEIILIAANVLALIVWLGKPSRAMWLSVAGLNLAALGVHALAEGLRYQLAFAYLFAALFAAYAFVKASGRVARLRLPRWLKGLAVGIAVLLLAFTAALAYALPVFALPKPTGEYAVGVKYLNLIDEARTEPFLAGTTQKRAIRVKLYYPAQPDDAKPFLPYVGGSSDLIRAFAAFYQFPDFVFDHFMLVKTHAKLNLAWSAAQPAYPVVLFSHGAGTSMEFATSQSEDLASHGYVVAAVDHPYVSAATGFPDHIVLAREATTNFDTPEPAAPITQIMADDDAFVIDALTRMNAGEAGEAGEIDPAFAGKLNLDEIGVMGHSVGGAVAYNMAIHDSRVKAAINLDGVVYVTSQTGQPIAPFLMLANDQYHLQALARRTSLMETFDDTPDGQQAMRDFYGSPAAYHAAYQQAQQNLNGLADVLKASGNLFTIAGSDHMKFADVGLFIGSAWLREQIQIRGATDPARCLEITQALTVAFFDQHLKGQPAPTLDTVAKRYPELRRVALD